MRLIIDSGSSKTDWAIINDTSSLIITTIGFNPQVSSSMIKWVDAFFELSRNQFAANDIIEIYFYGSGMTGPSAKTKLENVFRASFTSLKNLQINDDILGCARALLNNKTGQMAILGTGSIAAKYDGKEVVAKSISLGYMISDEGGGVGIGRAVLKAFINDRLTGQVNHELEKYVGVDRSQILHQLYQSDKPNRWIAGVAKIIHPYRDDKVIYGIISDELNAFIRWHLDTLEMKKDELVHFIGSIAHWYSSILKRVLEENGYTLGKIEKHPIEGLINYHKKN